MNQIEGVFPAKRQQKILEYIQNRYSITIREAAKLCQVSEATARRDLDEMSMQGTIERTHGGAVIQRGTALEKVNEEKMNIMIPEKTRIANQAFEMIRDGSSIFLDSGTTTFLLAKQLHARKNLTVITHNLDIAFQVDLDKSSTMVITGGIRRDGFHVLTGQIAEDLVNKLSVDVVFLGADAVNPTHGVFNSNFLEIGIKKSIVASGKHRVLLCDHTKFQHHALTKVCDIEEFDTVITDQGIDDEARQILGEKVKNLILV